MVVQVDGQQLGVDENALPPRPLTDTRPRGGSGAATPPASAEEPAQRKDEEQGQEQDVPARQKEDERCQ